MRTGGPARFFVCISKNEDLLEALNFAKNKNIPIFVLGGGSNTLAPDPGFDGLVIKIEYKGISYEVEEHRVCLVAGAGELWDDVVCDAVEKNFWGLENLSLIPGTIGGAAVQNIGAYGAEAKDSIVWVEVLDTETHEIRKIFNTECEFGYRESIFKKNKNLIIVRVAFTVSHNREARIGYEDVKRYFAQHEIIVPALIDIRNAIIAIRTMKMPASSLGTAGSFFKNPVVSTHDFEHLKNMFPDIKVFPNPPSSIKLSAAWLIDKVGGFRGVRRGEVGVHTEQALIIVNHGTASTDDVSLLAHDIQKVIKEKTGVLLEEEVVMM